jgi:hypothetical protein
MTRKKIKNALMLWVALTVGLAAASNTGHAVTLKFFTDSWKQTASNDTAITTGSFTVNFSLPLDGVDLSEADSNSQFSLGIGVPYNSAIVAGPLSSAENYVAGQTSATFALIITNDITDDLVTNGSVTVSWTATNITVKGSSAADLLGEAESLAGFVSTSKHDGYSTSPCELTVTLDASDNGGGTFNYDNASLVETGWAIGSEYTPKDGSAPFTLESGFIAGEWTFTPPHISLNSPVPDFKVYDAHPIVDLVGSATAGLGLANIDCYVNGDLTNSIAIDQSGDLPANMISWTAEVDLSVYGQVGPNTITVVAEDAMGNQTSVLRAFVWVETNFAVVTVNPPGAGSVIGIKNGQELQIGNGYRVTAVSTNKDWVFSYWGNIPGGSPLPSGATFDYFDTDGILTANFVPRSFDNGVLAGTYAGLFYDTNGVQLDDAGYISITVKDTGVFSGKLYLATTAAPFSLSGQFAQAPGGGNPFAEFQIRAGKSEYLDVFLVLTASDPEDYGSALLTGSVNAFSDVTETNLIETAEISAALSLNMPYTVPGLYNVVVDPPYTDPSQGPGGNGWGSVAVGKQGAATLVLNLPDGTSPAISFSSAVAEDGTCPIYASLYGGKGVILGWMQFAADGSGTMHSQNLTWIKTRLADKFYTAGFSNNPSITALPYFPPKAGTNLFDDTALTLIIDQGYSGLSLPDEVDDPVTFNPVRNTFVDTNKATITLTRATGALNGVFYPHGSKTPISYHGLEVGGSGYGFYLDAAKLETGPISIVDASGSPQNSGGEGGIIVTFPSPPVPPPQNQERRP